jgi:hypothetical protein
MTLRTCCSVCASAYLIYQSWCRAVVVLHEVQQNGRIMGSRGTDIAQLYSAGLLARWSRVRGSAGARNFFLHHRIQMSWGLPSLVIFSPWPYSGRGVKLTTRLHLVPRSRLLGAIPPLLQLAFMARYSVKARGQLYYGKSYLSACFNSEFTRWISIKFGIGSVY